MPAGLIIACTAAVGFAAAFAAEHIKNRRLSSAAEKLRFVDGMTGLYTRDGFLKEGAEQLERFRAAGSGVALVVFDIDALGKINTLFGTEVGDSVVAGFAKAVSAAADGYVCGRVDTDDFAVLIECGGKADVQRFIEQFEDKLNDVFKETAVMDQVGYFAGVAFFDGQDDIHTLYNKANLCVIMPEGGKLTYFNRDLENRMVENEFLRAEMLTAIAEGQFELYYQPKVSFKTGDVMGLEALIRWNHPIKGFVPPCDFIPLAEQTGIITKIDEWGLRTACRQCKKWQDDGLPPVKVSVNMSQAQFYCTDVLTTIKNVLEETGLDPKWLEIEVTETMAMKDIERTVNVLSRIRGMGVSISMDDFGSGYSSLSSLKTIPLDILKIDRSLVCDLDESSTSKSITEAIVDLGKAMKLIVLAEGVETDGQIRFLTEIGCDLAQGYYYSKPRSVEEITAFLMLPKSARIKSSH